MRKKAPDSPPEFSRRTDSARRSRRRIPALAARTLPELSEPTEALAVRAPRRLAMTVPDEHQDEYSAALVAVFQMIWGEGSASPPSSFASQRPIPRAGALGMRAAFRSAALPPRPTARRVAGERPPRIVARHARRPRKERAPLVSSARPRAGLSRRAVGPALPRLPSTPARTS